MTDFENWTADMDAWGLSGPQRTYHLYRLHEYHHALLLRAVARVRADKGYRELLRGGNDCHAGDTGGGFMSRGGSMEIVAAIVLWFLCGMYAARHVYLVKDKRRSNIYHNTNGRSTYHDEGLSIRDCAECSLHIQVALWFGVLAAVCVSVADVFRVLGWWTRTMERAVSRPTKRERNENPIIEGWGVCEKHGEASEQCTMCTVEASLCDHGEGGCTPTCVKVLPLP